MRASGSGAIVKAPDCARPAMSAAHGAGVAAVGLEQQALEIRGDLDVHRGRGRRRDAADLVGAAVASVRARMSLALVAIISRSTGKPMRLATQPASTSPKLPVGTEKETGRCGAAERDGGGEVIDRLRGDARPVDRVDAREPQLVAEARVVEHRLHERLAIVEGAFDRDGMHVRRVDRRSSAGAARRRRGRAGRG